MIVPGDILNKRLLTMVVVVSITAHWLNRNSGLHSDTDRETILEGLRRWQMWGMCCAEGCMYFCMCVLVVLICAGGSWANQSICLLRTTNEIVACKLVVEKGE